MNFRVVLMSTIDRNRDLFNGCNFKFGNPLDHFHKKLKGDYDI